MVYEAQQRSLDTDPAGASAENVGGRVVIGADRGLQMGRQLLSGLDRPGSLRTIEDSKVSSRADRHPAPLAELRISPDPR